MKIIVKLGFYSDGRPGSEKEVFTGESLEVIRGGRDDRRRHHDHESLHGCPVERLSDGPPILIVKDTQKNVILAEFTEWLCWVREE